MTEQLFNLATIGATAAMVIGANALFVAGFIDGQTNTLVLGLVVGGGAGAAAGAQAHKRFPPKG